MSILFKEMPNAIPYSPITTIVSITEETEGWEIIVDDITAFPAAPAMVVITSYENENYYSVDPNDYETIEYKEIDGSTLKQITRGVEGVEQSWGSGDFIAAFWTAEAYNRFKENIEFLYSLIIDAGEPDTHYGTFNLNTGDPTIYILDGGVA